MNETSPIEADGEVCIPINVSEQIEICFARGWTDGLPVIPANRSLVNAMLDACGLHANDVVATMPSRKVAVTAEKIAINAIMAGCKPEYMPVVIAAVKGLAIPEFVLHHVASGLSGASIMVVVNGPIAKKLGINSSNNIFGAGVRANATIGRTIRLILLNCLHYTPGVSDRAVMGNPGKYTCCIAEHEEDHPWQPLHVEQGFKSTDSTVTLIAITSMMQVWNDIGPAQLMKCFGDALSFLGSIAVVEQTPGTIILCGEHAQMLRESGLTKQQIREQIYSHTGRTVAELKRAGRIDGEITKADEKTIHYAIDSAERILLICAGSRVGTLSTVIPGWSMENRAGRTPPILI